MNKARDNILARLRARSTEIPPVELDRGFRSPDWNRQQRIELFCKAMTSVRTEIHRVRASDWADRLAQLVKERKLNNLLYAPNGPLARQIEAAWRNGEALPELVSRTAELDEWKEELFFGIDAAITSTRGGIAEVGALILWPTPQEPRSFSLVPPIHIAVVKADQLHNTFADAIADENWQAGMPTNAVLISGPSKSADIEQTLAYGVHGPVELIVLLIE
ncbi:LutC/YkgG family protein [Sedimenticola thiotaurini]|uniref:Lactate utilization protein B/C n=1 Tax=Sedimenticola thiotaurini TaxID=1543721 RepID=A0A0F7JXA2_9GAMM|nr:lactate utilization protein [Sedimenticola thiotaurini]AKH19974.1 lactate utilization protein B/C [Sedimenticola thiotaurini]